ncbi:polysaccharide biosynthesis protein [bacterium]|nr:polysaccharide biosynthesis protein [bacterium]
MRELFENKTVLVTGGTGSIGGEIVRQLLAYAPRHVRIYSRDEYKQFQMRAALADHPNLRFLLGDVRDLERLRRAVEGVHVIFHAAALKRVEACEYNPFEVVKTNVIGTENVITAALESGVEKVVGISTDKAVSPTGTMGATKLLAEKLMTWASFYRIEPKKTFLCVRFGNVLDSRGSVIPIFKKMIENGGPVVLHDDRMRRFVMSIPKAVGLVFKALSLAEGGEIFVLKMPVVRIRDLAEVLIEEYGPRCGRDPRDISLEVRGKNPGEKLDEELMTEEERSRCLVVDEYGVIISERRAKNYTFPQRVEGFTTQENLIGKEELRELLRAEGLV